MKDNLKRQVEQLALEAGGKEICGLLLNVNGREVYFPCQNAAKDSGDHFIITPEEYVQAEDTGEVLAVVHSHPYGSPEPSEADLVSCEASGLPWLIVATPKMLWREFFPHGYKAPLIGRQFFHGVLDCYALIRDWYKEVRNIDLPDFDRSNNWWNEGQNLYLDNFAKAGFHRVNDLKEGDVILMQIHSPVPNHAAVYLGNGIILQHLYNRLSGRDVYGGYWAKNTTHILRHESCVKSDSTVN